MRALLFRVAMFPDLISVLPSDKLREGHDVPTRIFDANFPCIVERFSHGSDDLSAFDGANDLVQVLDFHVEEGGAFTSCLRGCGGVFVSADVTLIHQFDVALLQYGEAELVALRNFHGLFKTQAIHPELDARLDVFHEQHRRDFLYGHVYGLFLCPWHYRSPVPHPGAEPCASAVSFRSGTRPMIISLPTDDLRYR